MPDAKRTAKSKRIILPRDVRKSSDFIKDCEKLSRSGRHDLNLLKEAMMLLIANDAPLPPEWRDHQLKGDYGDVRECHIKGDLLLMYQIAPKPLDDISQSKLSLGNVPLNTVIAVSQNGGSYIFAAMTPDKLTLPQKFFAVIFHSSLTHITHN